jgi:hypothetical protein
MTMSGYLVIADDDKGASISIGPVYNDASIDKLRRDVDDAGHRGRDRPRWDGGQAAWLGTMITPWRYTTPQHLERTLEYHLLRADSTASWRPRARAT